MSITELQIQLHKVIDTITDEDKLKAIYTILKKNDGPFKPLSVNEYKTAIDEAKREIEEGKYHSIEELERESDKW